VSYLIDTNVISEIRKGDRCNRQVASWYASIEDVEIYLSVLVLGEIRRGVERARAKEPARARALDRWLAVLQDSFADRILPIDNEVADAWGRMSAMRSVPAIDALLAATAKVHRMTLVTHNVSDFADLGADLLNPFEPIAARRS
jgi:predicted nucleic acid-binding protein